MKILRETKLEDKPYKFVYSNIGIANIRAEVPARYLRPDVIKLRS